MLKKVLHIISSTTWRGGEQQVDYLFNSNSSVYENYLFCIDKCELSNKNQHKKNKIFTYKKRSGFDIFAALKLKKICVKNKIDMIQLHDSHSINTYILADLFGMNVSAIIHRHVNFPINNKWKYQYKKIQKIICVSNEIKKNLSKFIDEKKLVVIHPGIDIGRWSMADFQRKHLIKQELNLSNETKLIGIVSALEPEKNIEEFIEIAHKCIEKNKQFHFIIIGAGSLLESCRRLAVGSQSNIHFLGFRNDIPQILSSLDIFLFTSKNEGFPLVLLEAMVAKLPVITGNFAAVNEIIQDRKTGFIYKDIEDAINNIECLMFNDQLKNATVKNAFNFVQQFDVTLMNQKIEKVYSELFNIDH